MTKPITDSAIANIRRALVTFGYSDLTDEEVREQVGKIQSGEPLNVIGMFAQKMLSEAGYLEA